MKYLINSIYQRFDYRSSINGLSTEKAFLNLRLGRINEYQENIIPFFIITTTNHQGEISVLDQNVNSPIFVSSYVSINTICNQLISEVFSKCHTPPAWVNLIFFSALCRKSG